MANAMKNTNQVFELILVQMLLDIGVKPSEKQVLTVEARTENEYNVFDTVLDSSGKPGSVHWIGIATLEVVGRKVILSFESGVAHGARVKLELENSNTYDASSVDM